MFLGGRKNLRFWLYEQQVSRWKYGSLQCGMTPSSRLGSKGLAARSNKTPKKSTPNPRSYVSLLTSRQKRTGTFEEDKIRIVHAHRNQRAERPRKRIHEEFNDVKNAS